MKVYSINSVNNNQNVGFKKCSNATKFGVSTLIASASFFMLSNAVDSFNSENIAKERNTHINIPASILGITGTFISLIGLKQDENEDENSNKNRH